MPRDTDIFADAGARFPTTYISQGDRVAFINRINDLLNQAGWTLADSGVISGVPWYERISQQSPWWNDLGTVPSDYVAKIRLRIYTDAASNVRLWASNAAETVVQTNFQTKLYVAGTTDPAIYRMIAWPYQFAAWNVASTTAGSGVGAHAMFLASALHTSRQLQESYGYRECLMATVNWGRTALHGGGSGISLFSHVKNNGGIFNLDNGAIRAEYGPVVIVPQAGGGRHPYGIIRFANMVDDPTLADASKWFPMHSPPMVAWADSNPWPTIVQGLTKMRGWLWDCVLVNEVYPMGYKFTLPDGNVWEAYTVAANTPTLFFRSA